MPVEMAVWRLTNEGPERVQPTRIESERSLEDAICADLSLIDDGLLLLGRQVTTASGKFVDLLAIDEEGTVHVIELKRDRTPREVVAQVLDYGSWVQDLGHDEVRGIFRDHHPGQEFDAAFGEAFGTAPPEELNERHTLVIVASELDPATERIIGYLSETHGVPVNAVFFRHFEDGDSRFLMRSWFIEPSRAEAQVEKRSSRRRREPWNGRDFYVAFGEGRSRNWEDARRYGFVSAGGGLWYSKSLRHLEPGHRIFVHVPNRGYVGVGLVTEPAIRSRDFTVEHEGSTLTYADAPLQAPDPHEHIDDPEKSEYLVRVDWIATVPLDQAHWEKGLFANQGGGSLQTAGERAGTWRDCGVLSFHRPTNLSADRGHNDHSPRLIGRTCRRRRQRSGATHAYEASIRSRATNEDCHSHRRVDASSEVQETS